MIRLKPLKKRLGDILVDVGIITTEQLQSALDTQKRGGGKLGEILAHSGAVNEEVLLAFIGKQCGASYVSLNEFGDISDDILHSIPESVARRQTLIPIARENNVLTVAMADPFNVFALDDIKVMSGFDVQVVIASEPDIKAAINKFYSTSFTGRGISEISGDESLNSILELAVNRNTTEIHLEPQSDNVRVRFKIDGVLHDQPPMAETVKSSISRKIKLLAGLDPQQSQLPSHGRTTVKIGDKDQHLKVAIIPTLLGERVTLKLLDPCLPCMDLSKLGFEPEVLAVFKKNIAMPGGLILITGPISAGKTTTLYSTLNSLNFPDKNIITIEDPVEYILPGLTQVQVNNEKSFGYPRALAHAIEHEPDIVMIGDLKDHETAEIAVDAALAGHLVFATLYSNGVIDALTHLSNMGVQHFKAASALCMVVSQRLMRTMCGECKVSYKLSKSMLHSLGLAAPNPGEDITLWRGEGCPACNGTGYSGQTAVFEVLELDEKLKGLVLEKAPAAVLAAAANEKGLLTLRESAWRKVAAGSSSVEELIRLTENTDNLSRSVNKC
jgi:type IV pilus assembly protein PilB